MTPQHIAEVLLVGYAATCGVAAFRLVRTGAFHMLPWFFAWLIAQVITQTILASVGWSSPRYPRLWSYLTIPNQILAVAMCLELHLFCVKFAKAPGRAPQVALLIIAALSIGATVTWYFEGTHSTVKYVNLPNVMFLVKRFVSFACLLFVILSRMFYRMSSMPTSRRIKEHRLNAVAFFALNCLTYFLIHATNGRSITEINCVLALGSIAIMVRWASFGPINEIELLDATEEVKRYIRREIERRSKGPLNYIVSEPPSKAAVLFHPSVR